MYRLNSAIFEYIVSFIFFFEDAKIPKILFMVFQEKKNKIRFKHNVWTTSHIVIIILLAVECKCVKPLCKKKIQYNTK